MGRYSVNKVILVGNLGGDPDARYTADGTPVANFTLATSRGKQDAAGAWTDETEWHRIVCWEKLAELAAHSLHKGSKVYVEGRIQSRKYTDRQGVERTAYDIVAHDLTLLDRATAPAPAPVVATSGAAAGVWDDAQPAAVEDIPFSRRIAYARTGAPSRR
jgi:single-strand DNA-binding protein